jgi:hypothetical protein
MPLALLNLYGDIAVTGCCSGLLFDNAGYGLKKGTLKA